MAIFWRSLTRVHHGRGVKKVERAFGSVKSEVAPGYKIRFWVETGS